MVRSQWLGLLLLAVVVPLASAQLAPSLPERRAADLAALDRFVRDSYAFFPAKATDWNRVIRALVPRARAARNDTAWLHVLEEALDALYEGHTQLNTNAPIPGGRCLMACVVANVEDSCRASPHRPCGVYRG